MPMPIKRLATVGTVAVGTNVALLSPTTGYWYLCSVTAANRGTTTAYITIWIKPSGATSNAETQMSYYAYQIPLAPSDVWESLRFGLNPGDILYANASTTAVGFTVNGIDQLNDMLAV